MAIAEMESAHDDSSSRSDALKNVWATYKSMAQGSRNFDDFLIHRDKPEAQAAANRQFDALKDRLWEVFWKDLNW